MKKATLILVFTGIILGLVLSCSKKSELLSSVENDEAPTEDTMPTSNNCKIKAYNNVFVDQYDGQTFADSEEFTYDADGRISKVKLTEEGARTVISNYTYTYKPNLITIKKGAQKDELRLKNGVVTSIYTAVYKATGNFEYNEEGYLSFFTYNDKVENEFVSNTLTYRDGNLVKVESNYSPAGDTRVINFYYSDELRKPEFFMYNPLFFVLDFFYLDSNYGKQSKNVMIRSDEVRISETPRNNHRASTLFTYIKDEARPGYYNAIIKDETISGKRVIHTENISYTCK